MEDIHIIWINLERSLERRKQFEKQLDTYNITQHTRVSGIDGASPIF